MTVKFDVPAGPVPVMAPDEAFMTNRGQRSYCNRPRVGRSLACCRVVGLLQGLTAVFPGFGQRAGLVEGVRLRCRLVEGAVGKESMVKAGYGILEPVSS